MPETIKSLKLENESLKGQIANLQKDFDHFQKVTNKKVQVNIDKSVH